VPVPGVSEPAPPEPPVAEACADDNQLAALLAGRLRPEARAALYRHVDHCEPCRRLLAAAAASVHVSLDATISALPAGLQSTGGPNGAVPAVASSS
jgi:hypothetical protein